MQTSKEVLELLTKAKDMRLNIAIFIVSSFLLYFGGNQYFSLESTPKSLLQGLVFITSIRLVYGVIGYLFDLITKKQEERKKAEVERENKKKSEEENLAKVNEIRGRFENLDIYQLYIIQELRSQNHIQVKKGAPLFTLKNHKIIYTPAVGDRHESAALTSKAKKLLDEEIWGDFDRLKTNALIRIFGGMQAGDILHFSEFLERDSICTRRSGRYGGFYNNEKVFSNYSKSIVFTQPQRNFTYIIDPVAKIVIGEILGNRDEAGNG